MWENVAMKKIVQNRKSRNQSRVTHYARRLGNLQKCRREKGQDKNYSV